jgi:catechol 2,3-dioxygenase-like lactoylglutathione lyase family enzyme
MSSIQASADRAVATPADATVEMKIEVAIVPVSDVDRAKSFYEGIGWRLDAEVSAGDDFRLVQMTPPGSAASIIFGKGITDGLLLAVEDIEVARDALVAQGVEVSETFHDAGGSLGAGFPAGTDGRAPGPDPEGRSYATYASFSDSEGNNWLLQEITERLPGR